MTSEVEPADTDLEASIVMSDIEEEDGGNDEEEECGDDQGNENEDGEEDQNEEEEEKKNEPFQSQVTLGNLFDEPEC